MNRWGIRRGLGLDLLGDRWFSLGRQFKLGRRLFDGRGGLGSGFHHRDFGDGRGWRRLLNRGASRKLRIGEPSGALESAAKFAKAFGTAQVGMADMDLLELGGKFGSAAVVTSAEDKVEELFKSRRVTRSAAQDGFKQADGFLSEPVAGEEVDVGEGLSDEFLSLVVEWRFRVGRDGSGFLTDGGRES